MVADPCEYTWSSHRYHGAGHADPILDSFPEWEQLGRTEPERRARWRRKVRGEHRSRSWMPCGRRYAVAGPTVQRTGSRSFPVASASSVSRAGVVVRHAKRCSDTGIPPSGACDDTAGRKLPLLVVRIIRLGRKDFSLNPDCWSRPIRGTITLVRRERCPWNTRCPPHTWRRICSSSSGRE